MQMDESIPCLSCNAQSSVRQRPLSCLTMPPLTSLLDRFHPPLHTRLTMPVASHTAPPCSSQPGASLNPFPAAQPLRGPRHTPPARAPCWLQRPGLPAALSLPAGTAAPAHTSAAASSSAGAAPSSLCPARLCRPAHMGAPTCLAPILSAAAAPQHVPAAPLGRRPRPPCNQQPRRPWLAPQRCPIGAVSFTSACVCRVPLRLQPISCRVPLRLQPIGYRCVAAS